MPSTGEILFYLQPNEIWDWVIYVVLFFSVVALFLIPNKQLFQSLLMTTVVGLLFLAKIAGTGELEFLDPASFAMLVINAIIFTFPLITAGMLKSNKAGKRPAAAPAILAGILGGVYFFMYWFLVQRGG